ncbi:MAG: hypothetical protein K0R38_5575 [Polyangiaceae bacterium]|jgi:hypothetical protein|nr:hypothetical protein [Polyangiaceae bacterium]
MMVDSVRKLSLTAACVAALSGCGGDGKAPVDAAGGSSGGLGTGGTATQAGTTPGAGTTNGGGSPPIGGGKSSAADVARKLGRAANFLIGMGNDLPADFNWATSGIYKLGAPLDLHYIYLVNGWQDWNPGGNFPKIIAEVDKSKGATPMSSVYAITGQGENNFAVLSDDAYMTAYWANAKLLMERYGELEGPALVHLEPDFWAYAQQKSGGDPSSVPARLAPECGDLPADLSGMARCWFKLARTHAPQVVIGLHASEWAAGSGNEVGEFLSKLGAAESDVVIIDMLDRDAGCFEAGQLDFCKRGGEFYLDETNQTSPNFAERLSFAKQVSTVTGKPILWWQIPFGVPSETPGGTPGHFRDNKVHYIFNHIQEFVDAGGVGVAFGVGAGEQTTPDTDGGQFQAAVQAYFAAPVPLP